MTTPPVTIPYGASNATLNTYLGSTGQKTDAATVGNLWSGAFGTTGTKYTGAPAQNAALLHALKTGYTSTPNNGNISGSASVKSNINTNTALDAASKAINPPASNNNSTTPPPPLTTTTPVTSSNPTIASYQTSTQTALTQAQNDSQVALKPITDTFNTNYQLLQNQKSDALKAARATYAAANPNGFGSDQDEYMASISSSYDTQIKNLSDGYSDAVAQNSQQFQDNVNTINATYQQNVVAYQQQQNSNLQWTLANDPPEPLDTSDLTPENIQSKLSSWASDNQDLINTAFSTGQYGDENNMQDYWNAVAQLSKPTKASIDEQTSLEKVDIDKSRLGIEAESAGATVENANTNAENSGATTQTSGPGFFQGLWKSLTFQPITKTTTKVPASDPLGILK